MEHNIIQNREKYLSQLTRLFCQPEDPEGTCMTR